MEEGMSSDQVFWLNILMLYISLEWVTGWNKATLKWLPVAQFVRVELSRVSTVLKSCSAELRSGFVELRCVSVELRFCSAALRLSFINCQVSPRSCKVAPMDLRNGYGASKCFRSIPNLIRCHSNLLHGAIFSSRHIRLALNYSTNIPRSTYLHCKYTLRSFVRGAFGSG